MVVLLSSEDTDFVRETRAAVRSAIEQRIEQLGLDPSTDIVFTNEESHEVGGFEAAGIPVAAVYFGGLTHNENAVAAAEAMVKTGQFLIPVVPDIETFPQFVPPILSRINGDAPGAGGNLLAQQVASRLVEALGLLRRRRLAFISYKRSESTGVARQLHDVLSERGFEVFLDSYSVEKGVDFQPVLWDRMADADVVILLDTKEAFTSSWLEKEISKATMLGLAILQLVWPEHKRSSGTECCDPEYLSDNDFAGEDWSDRHATLRIERATAVAATVESLRAKAFAIRRKRLVGSLSRIADDHGLGLSLQLSGIVDVLLDKKVEISMLPLVGHPDARHLHDAHLAACDDSHETCLLYDPISMLVDKRNQLNWLNEYLPLKALSSDDVGDLFAKYTKEKL
tara:strand:+ start:8580 stop:9770 length:1191 start_codon:yes stop_codon:yes gene_type:complete